ncbi:YcxB family protein [Streptomyces sp. NBC_00503]|uniref:YcxB family protein n=1 Tax=Streptomyces sp. NBC_00503 TaxID=2903659 RepID=UPI002E80C85B|nr:YcxB family protein [Streptomyces sp. NBC_00503]WUD81255.1 YcxB family protein [Streptomyces sp. NBC_00503]
MNTTDETVDLYYAAERGDFRELGRVRARRTETGRRETALCLLIPLVALGGGGTKSGATGVELAVLAGVGLLIGIGVRLGVFLSGARRQYARVAGGGEWQCTLSDGGLTYRMPDGTSLPYSWDRVSGWSETRSLFVFRHPGTDLLGFLPKRGALTSEDLDRARKIVARNAPPL